MYIHLIDNMSLIIHLMNICIGIVTFLMFMLTKFVYILWMILLILLEGLIKYILGLYNCL